MARLIFITASSGWTILREVLHVRRAARSRAIVAGWYTWQYLDDIRRMLKVPLLVKGIVTAEDATLCIDHGVDGIIVSNHGVRSMDYGPSTLEVLPEIVAAVNRRIRC